MRRLGAILMMLGANIVIGSVAAAVWRVSFQCAAEAVDGVCREAVVRLFVNLMTSGDGLIFWVVIVVGLLVFWRGKGMRGG